MKIAIVNYVGKTGKTTLAANLFAPRMPDAPLLAIESTNESAASLGVDVDQIRGERFREIVTRLARLDDAIIDVGASNIEDFLAGLGRFADASDDIDRFIVPCVPGSREERETVSMIGTLAGLGITANKLRIVFNRVQRDVTEEFPLLLKFVEREQVCIADPAATVYENEVFDLLSRRGLCLSQAISDPQDYKAALRALPKDADPREAARLEDMFAIKALARAASANLDTVFSAIVEEGKEVSDE